MLYVLVPSTRSNGVKQHDQRGAANSGDVSVPSAESSWSEGADLRHDQAAAAVSAPSAGSSGIKQNPDLTVHIREVRFQYFPVRWNRVKQL
jgi:hypothetical protein